MIKLLILNPMKVHSFIKIQIYILYLDIFKLNWVSTLFLRIVGQSIKKVDINFNVFRPSLSLGNR
jgi:hypothetical protein